MKMWSMKVIILLLFCYACLSTGNTTVYFISKNFHNVLHWDPVEPAFPGQKVLYSVQYWSDADVHPYQIKKECQNITTLSCDLTAETPSVHDVHYRAQVYVDGICLGRTNTFKPIAETTLGSPTLSTHTTVSSLHVNVTLPLGPNGVSIADIISSSKEGPTKTVIVYILQITHPKWAKQSLQVSTNTTGRFVVNLKTNQTEYCGYVVYKPSSEEGRPVSENASFCVTLPGNPAMPSPWLFGTAALLAAIIIISVVCMCNYLKGGKEKSMPQHLIPESSTQPGVLSPDPDLVISKPEFYVQSDDRTVYATILVKPNMGPVGVGGYSPQDIISIDSSVGTDAHSQAPTPEDTSAQSSETYGVVAVQVPAEEDEAFQQATSEGGGNSYLPKSSSAGDWRTGGTGPKPTSHEIPPCLDPNLCESNSDSQLLVQTVRDTNGQLMLPAFTLHLQSITGDTVSPLTSERKPLLSDLIDFKKEEPSSASLWRLDSSEWSDSGCDDSTLTTPTQPYCNTHYSPPQPVVPYFQQTCQTTPSSCDTHESAYKQNWMPEQVL